MPATVLIADNDAGVRSLLAEVVRRLECTVLEAADGAEARQRLAGERVHVLVCDLDMPRASGEEVLAWLGPRPDPPAVVVVSGYLDPATTTRLRALPCVRAVLQKPFDVLVFADLVRGLTRTASRSQGAS